MYHICIQQMDSDFLKEFQKVYIEKGKYDLTAQIPYLASLAESYKQRYQRSRNWMDCLKVSLPSLETGYQQLSTQGK